MLSLFTKCVSERALGRDDLLEPVWWAREPDGKMAKGLLCKYQVVCACVDLVLAKGLCGLHD